MCTQCHGPVGELAPTLLVPAALGGCTMVGGGAVPTTAPVPEALPGREAWSPEMPTASTAEDGDARSAGRMAAGVVDVALESIGRPYRWGGTGVNGFDCSGPIQYAYGRFGIRLPRVSGDQIRSGSADGVRASTLRNPYWQRQLVAARRIVG